MEYFVSLILLIILIILTYLKYRSFKLYYLNIIAAKEGQLITLNEQIQSLRSSNSEILTQKDSLLKDYNEIKQKLYETIVSFKEEIINLSKLNFELESDLKSQELIYKKDLKEKVAEARKDAVAKSRSILRGQATEHLAPYILKDTNPKDYRFMGNPIDYICFQGLSDVLDKTSDEITCVYLIDIKTGKSTLNKSQRRIRDAINAGRIEFKVINLDEEMNKENDNKTE